MLYDVYNAKTLIFCPFCARGQIEMGSMGKKRSIAHLHVKTNPMKLIWSDSEQWFLLYDVYNAKTLIFCQFCARGQIVMGPMGQKKVHCTSTCQDESNELNLERFWPIVFDLRCLQGQNINFLPVLCPRASQNGPNGQKRGPLHIYMPRRIQ